MTEPGLARFIDRLTMEYVRDYPHPIERVWRAITDPAEFAAWFGEGRLDLRVGGRFWFGDDGFQGEVGALDPPRLLRLFDDSAGQIYQYDLAEIGGGTRMRFTYRFGPDHGYVELSDPTDDPNATKTFDRGGDLPGGPGTPWRPGFLAGWHSMFDDLGEVLSGRAKRPSRWAQLIQAYRDHVAATIPQT